jgi:transposase
MTVRKRRRPSQVGNKPSAVQAFSVKEFFAEFSSDDVCLARIMEVRHGLRHVCRKCGKDSTFHKLASARAFACSHCGDHVHPTAGTILQDSRTSLQSWFYAMYLFTAATRHGVSGKELQRSLGVTYKTAWRMGMQIRDLMSKADGFEILKGHVEADEAFVGGRHPGKRGRGSENKTIVLGLKERGGRLHTKVIPDTKKVTLRGIVNETVEKGSIVSTDEYVSYNLLKGDGYVHGAVDHGRKEYAYTGSPDRHAPPRQPRRKLLEAVQGLDQLNPYPH